MDLRWNWDHGADELWSLVDPESWQSTANPWLILETVSDQRLVDLAGDRRFLDLLQRQLDARESHFQADTWFSSNYSDVFHGHIAYFSMEFGLSESLPVYSGGLGVLAGDNLKTACDLNVPVIALGLLYQRGYFRQSMDAQGNQIEFYPYNNPSMLPVVPMRDQAGEWVRIGVELPGRLLRLRVWHAQVGRRSLLLLDSNDLLNDPGDRGITSELYGGRSEQRLQQEIVLGIGGWRLLVRLGLDCPVCHLNEGHAAFAILERARQYMLDTGQDFHVALRTTRAGNLFTSHTPVATGFDSFERALFMQYFGDYAARLGISIDALMALGDVDGVDHGGAFNMAYLAMHGAGAANAVSRLHGVVTRQLFQQLFPRWPVHEVPVGYVTNGVHMPTWDSACADALWTRVYGKGRWRGVLETVASDLQQLTDEELWQFRTVGRQQLVSYLRDRVQYRKIAREVGEQDCRASERELDFDILTLGFARRFTDYKRPNLLLHDPERLMRLLNNRDRPVQLVLAGKAHPQDQEGKRLLREWQEFLQRNGISGRVVFIEDYDLTVAQHLVQGVDIWINTPRRPWEACGTSGMKVLVNGGINLSELDGWWAEAYSPEVGWALGDGREHADVRAWDAVEAEQLYQLLENQVIPCFYQRDAGGLPRQWIQIMRQSMARLTAQYSSNRMLRQYVEQYYLPLAAAYRQRSAGVGADLQQWHDRLGKHWGNLRFGGMTWAQKNDAYHITTQVYLDDLLPDDICVELYAEPSADDTPARISLQRGAPLAGATNAFIYHGTATTDRLVNDYTLRIVAAHESASVPLEANFILWNR